LNDEQQESNRWESKVRARIEPVFEGLRQTMKGFYLRSIGRRRNSVVIGFVNLIYSLARYKQIVRSKLLPLRGV